MPKRDREINKTQSETCRETMFAFANKLTTPGESTNIRGVRVDESSTTAAMSKTGGSTNLNIEKKERNQKQVSAGLPSEIIGLVVCILKIITSPKLWITSHYSLKTYLDPKLLTMKDVAVKDTRSGRRDRTTNILCSSLHAFSHSPGGRKRKQFN